MTGMNRFSKFAILNVAFTVLVILWGAVVRATGSGAGCADHWPDCAGQIIPTELYGAKAIEFTHRAMTGVWILLIFALVVVGFRTYQKGHAVRRGLLITVVLGVIECGIGAALVKFKWVAGDTSIERAIAMALHHCNTALLLGAMTVTAWLSMNPTVPRLRKQGGVAMALVFGGIGLLATIVSGAITALGDTLFPPQSSIHTMQQALSEGAHFLERLRILHPPISVGASLFLVLAVPFIARSRESKQSKQLTNWLTWIILAQILLGFINVLLKAPIWMQLVHLAVADAAWIVFLCVSAALLSVSPAGEEVEVAADSASAPKLSFGETVSAYVALTKPRVVSLLLFTTLAAMFVAARGAPDFWLIFWVAIGGYFMAGAANAVNMVIDRDIDLRMARTSKRPTVTHAISAGNAMIFALTLCFSSFVMLTWAANLLTAFLAFAGLLFYIFIYTLLLKRRTWQNIVIGGAAGSFPPLVGYAAVSGELNFLAWFLFALIFFWTPVHFWALALLIKDDYAEAGVPMLPVVRGDQATVIQIAVYAVLTALISVLPLAMNELGWVYLAFAGILNAILLLRSFQLMKQPDRPQAVRLFKFSMLYLALVFVVIAVDRMQTPPPNARVAELGICSASHFVDAASVEETPSRNSHATAL